MLECMGAVTLRAPHRPPPQHPLDLEAAAKSVYARFGLRECGELGNPATGGAGGAGGDDHSAEGGEGAARHKYVAESNAPVQEQLCVRAAGG